MKKNICIAFIMVFIMNILCAETPLENALPAYLKANDGYINLLNAQTKSWMEQPAFQSTDCDTIILKDGSILVVEIRRSKNPSVIRFSKCGATDGTTSVVEISNVLEIKSEKHRILQMQEKEMERLKNLTLTKEEKKEQRRERKNAKHLYRRTWCS